MFETVYYNLISIVLYIFPLIGPKSRQYRFTGWVTTLFLLIDCTVQPWILIKNFMFCCWMYCKQKMMYVCLFSFRKGRARTELRDSRTSGRLDNSTESPYVVIYTLALIQTLVRYLVFYSLRRQHPKWNKSFILFVTQFKLYIYRQ